MKHTLFAFVALFLLSCENKKVLQLPEISHSEITNLTDVSHAYLFYNETQPDSVELNRKNLISTTNWLINVDKRLTLKQAIPHIKFLQDKKKSSSHKNENAKNYFTCHDLSRNNLGFLEFSDIAYEDYGFNHILENTKERNWTPIIVHVESADKIFFLFIAKDESPKTNTLNLKNDIENILKRSTGMLKIILSINKNISFQDYISIKTQLSELKIENLEILEQERIY
ncbi:hypothetical protein [Algibacter sp. 2305UL17-15]|uniref:hypothetical protein n=1 Tax=Algibacter sp. 2305UL17-15 TaxID=3231268 RepID=UPI00345777CD